MCTSGRRPVAQLASHAPRAGQQPQFAVDGIDVAHPWSLGPYTDAALHPSGHYEPGERRRPHDRRAKALLHERGVVLSTGRNRVLAIKPAFIYSI